MELVTYFLTKHILFAEKKHFNPADFGKLFCCKFLKSLIHLKLGSRSYHIEINCFCYHTLCQLNQLKKKYRGGHHSTVVSSAPTILWPWVRSNPKHTIYAFSTCIFKIVIRKE